jgi:transcriptional regulator GlxA family with amidase domain
MSPPNRTLEQRLDTITQLQQLHNEKRQSQNQFRQNSRQNLSLIQSRQAGTSNRNFDRSFAEIVTKGSIAKPNQYAFTAKNLAIYRRVSQTP